jgi:hypothetical protein
MSDTLRRDNSALRDFAELLVAVARSETSLGNALDVAGATRASLRTQSILRKAAGSGALTTTSGIGDFRVLAEALIASLSNSGAFDRVLQLGRRMPLERPGLRLTSAVSGAAVVSEGSWKPIGTTSIAPAGLRRRKAAALMVLTDELLRQGGEGLLRLLEREITAALVGAVDAEFVPELAAVATSVPAAGDVAQDLAALIDALPLGSTSSPILIIPSSAMPALAVRLTLDGVTTAATWRGGTIAGVPVVSTPALPLELGSPGATVVAMALDADRLAVGADELMIEGSGQADVRFEGDDDMVSLWQTGSRGVKVERSFGWQVLTDTAVVALVEGGS